VNKEIDKQGKPSFFASYLCSVILSEAGCPTLAASLSLRLGWDSATRVE
jgi:hypothetical protein